MDSEDGQVFVKNLAYFVKNHETALANALHLHHQRKKNGQPQATAGASSTSSSSSSFSTSISLSDALSRPYLSFSSYKVKDAKLTLTPHHLYFLLSKFEDLGVDVGPMNVRLENLQHDATPSNYVSFLGHAPKTKGRQSDAESLKSTSSVRSVMSSMSSLWSNLTLSNSAAKAEKHMAQHREDIKYLYSCFTKIPALKLSPDHRARLISGYEEFPFDSAVPLFAFKNISSLEICDLDFRQFHGWDRLAEQIRSLTVKRANVDDPIDLLQNIVLDDMEKRRKRSFKTLPTTPSTPGMVPWSSNSPKGRQVELARTVSAPTSPLLDHRRGSVGSPSVIALPRAASSESKNPTPPRTRERSTSPRRPPSSRQESLTKHARSGSLRYRRNSGSSGSSAHDMTPRHSSSDLLALGGLPASKWRFLRHLSVAENGLTWLTAASLAPVAGTLQSLDLSGNLFVDIPDAIASLTHLRALNLSNCMIQSLQSLLRSPITAITVLNLRSNRLQNLTGIERLLSLERVDLRDNRLRDPMELARLSACPEILDLYVVKNPFAKTYTDYRVTIFNAFRSSPGHVQDVTIDGLGPTYNEKKHLVDRAPERVNVPVVRPPADDEDDEQTVPGGAPTTKELRGFDPAQRSQSSSYMPTHRRAISDAGPHMSRRKKRVPRRRVVELSQAQSTISPTSMPPPLLDAEANVGPKTPIRADTSLAPDVDTPYHTAPTTQIPASTTPQPRPTLDTSFPSPTPGPRIRDPSDDDDEDDSPLKADPDLGHSKLYRQKIEALKHDFGSNWLSALHEDRMAEQQSRNRSFSPASRSSTIRNDAPAPARSVSVGVGGRTLG